MRTAQQLDTDFLARLTSIVQVKQSNLSKVFWAATLDADEFEHNLGLSVDPLPTDMESIAGPSQEALDHLVHIAQGLNDLGVETDSERLETKLQALDQLRFGGRLNRSLQVATAYLDVVTSLLKETLEVGRLCPQGIPSRRGKILYNVLRGQYIDGIQPYMTKLDRHGRAWLQSLNKLFALQPAEIPDTMKRYQDAVIDLHNPNGLWRRFRAAQQLHTDAWQAVLESCGIKAGSPAT